MRSRRATPNARRCLSPGGSLAFPLTPWHVRSCFGAFQDDELAGVAGLSFELCEKARHKATLFGMCVPTKFRCHGLGRLLVRAVLDHAAERSCVRIVQLTVTHGNADAQSLYEKCGFVQHGL